MRNGAVRVRGMSTPCRCSNEGDIVMQIKSGTLVTLAEGLNADQVDLFIGSVSFDNRCTSIRANLGSVEIKNSIIAVNRTFDAVMRDHESWFACQMGQQGEFLDVFIHDPVRSLLGIQRAVGNALSSEPRYILVDITSFTSESLLMLVRVLNKQRMPSSKVDFVYARAEQYSTDSKSDASRWLSDGIRDIRPVLGYPGTMVPSHDTHMIVMVGFEDERALQLIRACEPTHVSLGTCDPTQPDTSPHQNANVGSLARLRSVLADVNEFTFRGYSVTGTEEALLEQADRYSDCNVVIAPMSTKISTAAAAILALRHESFQLCYAAPYFYNFDHYSSLGDRYHLFSVPLIPT